jgi:alpha-tubulin suppressor-like RCC1 family protein
MSRKMARSAPLATVRAARGSGSRLHRVCILQEGRTSANIHAQWGIVRGIPVNKSGGIRVELRSILPRLFAARRALSSMAIFIRVFVAGCLLSIFAPTVVNAQNPPIVSNTVGNPVIVNIFWDQNWDQHNPGMTEDQINNFTSALVNSSYFSTLAAEHGVGPIRFAGGFTADPKCGNQGTAPNIVELASFNPTEVTINTFINCEGSAPHDLIGPNVIFNIFFPPATTEMTLGQPLCPKSSAYHFHGVSQLDLEGFAVEQGIPLLAAAPFGPQLLEIPSFALILMEPGPLYTAIFTSHQCLSCATPLGTQCSASSCSSCGDFASLTANDLSHELLEAVSDPIPPLSVITTGGGEIADLCEPNPSSSTNPNPPTDFLGEVIGLWDSGTVTQYFSTAMNHCAVGFTNTTVSPPKPSISHVETLGPIFGNWEPFDITVSGSGFGDLPPSLMNSVGNVLSTVQVPGQQQLPYFSLEDNTAGWLAGNSLSTEPLGKSNALTYQFWGDGTISANGIMQLSDFVPSVSPGDQFNITACNPTSGACTKNITVCNPTSGACSQTPPLVITTSTLPDAQAGVPYNQSLVATGGQPPYGWSYPTGATLPSGTPLPIPGGAKLPTSSGLTFTPSGVISGASPSENFSGSPIILQIQVKDNIGDTATALYTLNIDAPQFLTITPTNLPPAQQGVPYQVPLTVTGGIPPYKWSSSPLPLNLTLGANGLLSGTPSNTGSTGANSVLITVSDSNTVWPQTLQQPYVLFVGTGPLMIPPTSLPNGEVGQAYGQQLTAFGGTAPYTWSAKGILPAGLTLTKAGSLNGVPGVAATNTFTVRVEDSSKPLQTAQATMSLTVTPAPLEIKTFAMPAGQVGQPYSATLQATGGVPPYSWYAVPGYPPGLSASSPGSATITGTPTQFNLAGGFLFSAGVVDSAGNYASRGLAVLVQPAPPSTSVWAWGSNTGSQLGSGTNQLANNVPIKVPFPSTVANLAGGANTAYALDSTGEVWAWGSGGLGALGYGYLKSNPVPQHVSLPSDGAPFKAIAAGDATGYALDKNGGVWAWGAGGFGELGTGAAPPLALSAVKVKLNAPVVAIAAAGHTAYALDSSGQVWAWGLNDRGQLGNGSITPAGCKCIPTPLPMQAAWKPRGVTIKAIAGGGESAYALDSTGAVWAWGLNDQGQLGNGTASVAGCKCIPTPLAVRAAWNPSGVTIKAIAGGGESAYALDSTGSVWAWGLNDQGQLGNGTASAAGCKCIPVPVAVQASWRPRGVIITTVAGGGASGYALDSAGGVWAWGGGAVGQLGNALYANRAVPTQVVRLPKALQVTGGIANGYALQ